MKNDIKIVQVTDGKASDKQTEIFARRLLPEIKRFFADEDVRKEFEDWKKKRGGDKVN